MTGNKSRDLPEIAIIGGGNIGTAIDKVTSPRGATIAGLNRMEHEGFSSAMIKGIVTSAEKVAQLYAGPGHD